MKKVLNRFGDEINFDFAVQMMDDELREELHNAIAPCSKQEFFDAYALAHMRKYGEVWVLDTQNPQT